MSATSAVFSHNNQLLYQCVFFFDFVYFFFYHLAQQIEHTTQPLVNSTTETVPESIMIYDSSVWFASTPRYISVVTSFTVRVSLHNLLSLDWYFFSTTDSCLTGVKGESFGTDVGAVSIPPRPTLESESYTSRKTISAARYVKNKFLNEFNKY